MSSGPRAYGQGSVWLHKNGYWHVFLSVNGQAIRQSSRSKNKADAVRLLKQLQNEASVGRTPSPAKIRVSDLLDDLIADYEARGLSYLRPVRFQVKRLRRDLGHLRPAQIGPSLLARVVTGWRNPKAANGGLAVATVNRHLGTLHRAFNLAMENGKVGTVPRMPHLPEDNARRTFLEPPEFQVLLSNAPDSDLHDLWEWLYGSSMRWGEATSLQWTWFDQRSWELRIPASATKNRKARVVPVVAHLRAIIERRLASRHAFPDCKLIFGRRGKKITAFVKSWATSCHRAGLKGGRNDGGITPHDLRRSAARNMRRAGIQEKLIMDIGGWKTRAMFERYNIVDQTDMREALGQYDRFLASSPLSAPTRTSEAC